MTNQDSVSTEENPITAVKLDSGQNMNRHLQVAKANEKKKTCGGKIFQT